MVINYTLILLIISILANTSLITILLRTKDNTQIKKAFLFNLICLLICMVGQTLQILMSDSFNIQPIYFDYFVYIGTCFLPVSIFFTGLIFENTKIKFTKKHLLLFIIPIISLIVLWSNDFHHLFYKNYSVDYQINEYGPYFTVHNIYSYLLLFLGILHILRFSIKNVGFFSKQSVLVIIGISIPSVVNILGTFQIIPMTIYYTPISFTFTIVFFFLAIFRFNFLKVAPIALQRIVDRISDSYIVVGEDNNIIDFNKTLISTFKIDHESSLRGKKIDSFIHQYNLSNEFKKINEILVSVKSTDQTVSFELFVKEIKKFFNVEINSILSKGEYLGTLILFKDITQHKHDIETIKSTQESLMESERLSSLGQLIGGIAHNLKTPIMSIAGATEGLSDLIKEYDESIDDPTVNSQDHHDIAKDMSKWIKKIKDYTEYMSDVITTVKGQAVTMSNDDNITFTVAEVVKRVNILMKHELKNAIITLNIIVNVDENTSIHGDVNNLIQVINNMISNAIQAYNGKTEENIEFIITRENNYIVFSIEDHAAGLPEKVKEKLFKEMITTKGKNGTGLGLYMSYSTIKAHFNGNITYESETGKGTKFNIYIPVE